jgi:hypothetical protein
MADPPQGMIRTEGSSVPVFSRYWSRLIQTVGTPAGRVTASSRIRVARLAGSRKRSGKTSLAPTMVAA